MNPTEFVFGGLLAGLLLVIAGYYSWRQKKTLAFLRENPQLSSEDKLFYRKQASRRLFSSILMVAFAAMLIGWFFLEPTLPRPQEGQVVDPQVQAEARTSVQIATLYWILALFLLLGILFLAAVDFMAIARFGLVKHRQLEADRRADLAEQVAKYRRQGNGQK